MSADRFTVGTMTNDKRLRFDSRVAPMAASIFDDHRRIVEFDGRIDMKLRANHPMLTLTQRNP